MLKRQKLRRYLLALLYLDDIVQSPDCDRGLLFKNCDGTRPDVFDSPTIELMENASGEFLYKKDSITIAFQVKGESYYLSPTRVSELEITFQIDIIANASSGEERQNMLDVVQERILYRLFSYPEFIDQETDETLKSFLYDLNENTLRLNVSDETEYDGSNTVRSLSFSYKTSECIQRPACEDTPLCFDFKNIKLGGC